jgi:uncharacterized protein (TIGR02117 family)
MAIIISYILKPLGGFFELFHAFMSFYLLISLIGGLIPVGGEEVQDPFGIFVRSNGIHTDFILPVETDEFDWKEFIPIDDYQSNAQFKYIAIGWGDRGFFINTPTWDDLTAGTFLTAVLINSPTAMHVQYFDYEPEITEKCKYVEMERSKYAELTAYICDSFKKQDGKVDLIEEAHYWSNDAFYEARGNYHMFRTCNRWTNVGLKVAGVKTGLYSLWSDDIMRHLN